ncbi:DUF4956 domain-containing protein [Paenibacillus sp. CGMCC 1.16610]|uniref:DUF4956 domain-containing protein n=1 Tax=Paenibacillus anseongense TaxID=2682845 RepID=A0ABW9U2U3_9BACL|nr:MULTISPECIES: DUF4956 domain-containing protein [Paenibacillus]MBA2941866.1 DUF4956 domain-containing protein [Paenibacillus sp. CGMCC 1.16610]MVQ34384.1 DUF4956 domain-containing protein [Paenibacillus anseongense]
MIDTILTSMQVSSDNLTFVHALLTILISFALGAIISFTYMKTQPMYNQSFTLTMIVLPAIIAVIILLIGSNIARAFSLAGAFSIIRFRSAPGDPKDIAFVLFTMAAGLACGVGSFGYAVLFTVALCLLMFFLKTIKFGAKKSSQRLLKVTIPENLGYEEAFDEIFNKFGIAYELRKVKTTELGSLYELVYMVTIDHLTNQKDFLDAIRCRNGNLDITLTMNPTEAAQY